MSIKINGTIVSDEDRWIYDFFGIANTTPSDVEAQLEAADHAPVTIEISSGGGDVIAANEIYYRIAEYGGATTSDITGLAASAASYIALASDRVRIAPTAIMMIHNVSGYAEGNYHAMDQESKVLKQIGDGIAIAYEMKTGLPRDRLLGMMDRETWLTSEKALELGFVDEVIGAADVPVAVYNSFGTVIPPDKIAAIKAQLRDQPEQIKEKAVDFTAKNQKFLIF